MSAELTITMPKLNFISEKIKQAVVHVEGGHSQPTS